MRVRACVLERGRSARICSRARAGQSGAWGVEKKVDKRARANERGERERELKRERTKERERELKRELKREDRGRVAKSQSALFLY